MKKTKFDIDHEIDKVILTLQRLNNMWSFTGSQLTYAADAYLQPSRGDDLDRLFDIVHAYAAMTKAAVHYSEQGYVIPDEWNRLFGKMGQFLFFYLPEVLPKKREKVFNLLCQKKFSKAWRESPLPLSPGVL